MRRAIIGTILINFTGWLAFGQSADTPPKFEIADVHVSAKTQNQFVRAPSAHGGRYELKLATMVDLIRFAYGFTPDKILGGPSWLEMDRYDVLAKLPPDSTPDTQKLMLQSLLADRFKLVVHPESKPLPAYFLVAGKKPLLKEADGSGETGCKPQSSSAGAGGDGVGGMVVGMVRVATMGANGTPTTFTLGPGGTITYQCRNMTIASFVENLRSMFGVSLGTNPVTDETGLKGKWNFDVSWSMGLITPMMDNAGDRVTIFQAFEKQLGLKLEERPVPTPVIVVESVNQKPSGNPPNLAEVLPVMPPPTEFEVADVKVTDPEVRMGRFQVQPGGRVTIENMPLRMLLTRAFNTNYVDQLVGLPKFADTDRYTIMAKAAQDPSQTALDMESLGPLLLKLIVERFKMTYHTEERPMSAYSLVSAKPKMKKADPNSRTNCKNGNAPSGAPPATRVLTCQNITMGQFADRLRGMSQELIWPVLDATGIEGGWDFTLTYSMAMMMMGGRGGFGMDAGPGAGVVSASDPTGGITIFQALEKQLGLKLEMQKRPMPVYVIDHIEQKPTDN